METFSNEYTRLSHALSAAARDPPLRELHDSDIITWLDLLTTKASIAHVAEIIRPTLGVGPWRVDLRRLGGRVGDPKVGHRSG